MTYRLKMNSQVVYLAISNSRSSGAPKRVVFTPQNKIKKIKSRGEAPWLKALRIEARKALTRERFDVLSLKFLQFKRWLCREDRQEFDAVLKRHFRFYCSAGSKFPNFYRYTKRWPSALAEKVYAIHHKNKLNSIQRAKLPQRLSIFKSSNSFGYLKNYPGYSRIVDDDDVSSSFQQETSSPKITKRRDQERFWYQPQPRVEVVEQERDRNPILLAKLRAFVAQLQLKRVGQQSALYYQKILDSTIQYLKKITLTNDVEKAEEAFELTHLNTVYDPIMTVPMPEDSSKQLHCLDNIVCATIKEKVVAQMEEPHGSAVESMSQDQKQNVVLLTHAEESSAEPITITSDIWKSLCSSHEPHKFDQITGRWQRLTSFRWSSNHVVNTKLMSANLPGDIVNMSTDIGRNCANVPLTLPFKQFAYVKSDIEIKIVINSNKFHCGSLQASFYYGAELDAHYQDRENVFSASQMTHCIVDASSASDGILTIPYRYYKPMIATTNRGDDQVNLNIGTLKILVLNSLHVPTNDINIIDVTVYMRLFNTEFHGMIPRDLAQNQMLGMAALVKETSNLLNQIYPDPQRDNPTDVTPAKPLVPWNAHSWCLGDITPEPTNVLRLQATGTTPHPPGTLATEPEMDISYIVSIFGLFKQVSWSTSHAKGEILTSFPFSPNLDKYPTVSLKNNPYSTSTAYTCDVMPPISVISSLFAYWRGSIEYRLDFLSTQFHTGRLIIAFVPRLVYNSRITIDQLSSCDNVVFDLRDNRQITYVSSFVSDKPWYPHRSLDINATENYPPGYIYIAVLNELTAPPSVSNTIEFNIYIKGGSDFELHVPVAPKIGLSFNTDVQVKNTNLITYVPSYGPPQTTIYIGKWHSVDQGYVLRYGPTSDHITQFTTTDLITNAGKVLTLLYQDSTMCNINGKMYLYFVMFSLGGTYAYMACFNAKNYAEAFARTLKEDNGQHKVLYRDADVVDSEGKVVIHKSSFYMATGAEGSYSNDVSVKYWKQSAAIEDFIIVENQGLDERKVASNAVDVQSKLTTTNSGNLTFGENITNLKQVIRRYQPYGLYSRTARDRVTDPCKADLAFPVLPQGLDLQSRLAQNVEFPFSNRVRDGPIPIIASGYRFFRGSVRYRYLVNTNDNSNVSIWVQHRPDQRVQARRVYEPDNKSVDAYFRPGYGYYIQFSNMNNVIEFEVPYYLPGQFGLLQTPDLHRHEDAVHYSLGTIYTGVDYQSNTTKETQYTLVIFYSMGDDMTFSVFQGFPPMIDLSIFDKPQSQGPLDWAYNKVKISMKKQIENDISSSIVEAAQSLNHENLDSEDPVPEINLMEAIYKLLPDVTEEKRLAIFNVFSQLVHSMIEPSVRTIAWSIASVLTSLGLLATSYIEKFCNTCWRFLQAFLNKGKTNDNSPNESDEGENAVAQGPEEADAEAAFISTCVAGMLALVGACDKPLPKTLPSFSKYLYEGLPRFSLTSNGFYIFLRNNLKMFKKIWFWLVSWINPDYLFWTEMYNSTAEVKDFVRKCQWSLDARNEQAVRMHPKYTCQVYSLANIAQSYLAKKSLSSIKKDMPMMEYYCKKIIDLRDKLTRDMLSPNVRFEPFVLSFNGESNCGKSHLAQHISTEILQAVGFTTYDEIVYTRTPGNAYWNGLRNQPVCLFDDFLNIVDPTAAHVQLGELFCLKSKAVFNPPMAAIEEKKLRYNPLLVMLCHNEAFPKITGMACQEAWYRRRDLMFEVRKKQQYKGTHPRDLPSNIKSTYGHLEFAMYNSSTDKLAGLSKWMSYEEMLPIIISKFHLYFLEECVQYDLALTKLAQFYPDDEVPTPEYVKLLDKQIQDFSDERCNPDDLQTIKRLKQDLSNEYSMAPMTKFVKRKLAEEKLKDIQAEKACGTSALAQGALALPRSLHYEDILKLDMFPTEISNCKDYLQRKVIDDLLFQLKDFVSDTSMLKCDCWLRCFFIKHVYLTSTAKGQDFELVCNPTQFLSPMLRFKLADMMNDHVITILEGCGTECVVHQDWYVKWFVRYYASHIEGIPENNMPAHVLCHRLVVPTEQTIKYMTPAEVDKMFAIEVADKTWYQRLWDKIPGWGTVFFWLTKATVLLSMLGMFIKTCGGLFNLCTGNKTKEGCAEIITAGVVGCNLPNLSEEQSPSKYENGTVSRKVSEKVPVKQLIVAQATESIEDTVSRLIARNTFFLMVKYGEVGCENIRMLRCLGLINNYYLLLDHYAYFIKEAQNIQVSFVRHNECYVLDNSIFSHFSSFPNSTFLIGKLPATIPHFKNIVKFFVRSKQSSNLAPSATLYEMNIDQSGFCVMTKNYFNRLIVKDKLGVDNDNGTVTMVGRCYAYERSAKGVCGSVLVSSTNINSPILGIHIAGNSSLGYSEALVFESFIPLLDKCHIRASEEAPLPVPLNEDGISILPLTGNIHVLGTIPKSAVPRIPNESRLIPTECSGFLTKPTYEVPLLSSKDSRLGNDTFSPLLEGCKHHTNPAFMMPPEFVAKAIDDYKDVIMTYVKPVRMDIGKLSIEQAVCGIHNLPEYEALPMDTSEGFPWMLKRPKTAHNKQWLFDRQLTNDGWTLNSMNADLLSSILKQNEQRETGYYCSPIFVDSLKDAKLPKEKVLIPGKTRIFSVSPVDFSISVRQYTMDFVVAFTKSRFYAEHAIGIDIYSRETDFMVQWMLEFGNNMACGDYSKFGDQLYADCIIAVYDIIAEWYDKYAGLNEQRTKAIKCFAFETAHAHHLMGNLIYQCFGGMPSGNPLTVVINSMVNSMYIRIAWQQIMTMCRSELASLQSFNENVRVLTYGDDLWLSLKDDIKDIFNIVSMSNFFKTCNIKFTSATKGDLMIPYSVLSDSVNTTFLKCSFHKHPIYDLFVARLDIRAVEEICNWTWSTNKDIRAGSIEACVSMLPFYFGYGPDIYDLKRKQIIQYWIDKGVKISLPYWSDLNLRIYGGENKPIKERFSIQYLE